MGVHLREPGGFSVDVPAEVVHFGLAEGLHGLELGHDLVDELPVMSFKALLEIVKTVVEIVDLIPNENFTDRVDVGARPVLVGRRVEAEAVQRFRPFSDDRGPRQRIWLRHVAQEEAEADPDAPPAPDRSPDRSELEVYELALAGRHQVDNLATAVVAAEELRELGWERLTPSTLRRGARACHLAGRLEEVVIPDRAALPGGGRVLLDAAHNAAGAAALALAIRDLGEPADLVFGVLSDKDAAAMLEALVPRVTRVTLTSPPGERGRKAESLEELVDEDALAGGPRKPGRPKKGEAPGERVDVIGDPGRAIESALKKAEGRIVVATGSVALVGALRGALRRRYGVPR
jgi:folylpolyglutamate synthase/dihydropteroate synthase